MWGGVCETSLVRMWVYVGVCGRMWGGVCEPNHLSSGMVHGSYVGVCGAYVGVCGLMCVNQTRRHIDWFRNRMWAYVGCMWVYVGVYV